jgi:hypothetical protein
MGVPGTRRKSSIPGGLWMITVGRNAILGSYSLEIVFLSLGAFSRHFGRKLLKSLPFLAPGICPLVNLPSIKRAGQTTLCPDPTENAILFGGSPGATGRALMPVKCAV